MGQTEKAPAALSEPGPHVDFCARKGGASFSLCVEIRSDRACLRRSAGQGENCLNQGAHSAPVLVPRPARLFVRRSWSALPGLQGAQIEARLLGLDPG
jgi:hypothetical protein